MTTTLHMIKTANCIMDLHELVIEFTSEHGCELDNSRTYAENAEWYEQEGEDGVPEMAEMLRIAEKLWFELEDH